MIQINTGDSRPIFQQIIDGFRVLIARGELAEGDKLPSVRGLAMELTINTNTVAKAYEQLSQLGLVESRKGLGLFVAQPHQQLSDEERQMRLQQAVDEFIVNTIDLNFETEELISQLKKSLDIQKK